MRLGWLLLGVVLSSGALAQEDDHRDDDLLPGKRHSIPLKPRPPWKRIAAEVRPHVDALRRCRLDGPTELLLNVTSNEDGQLTDVQLLGASAEPKLDACVKRAVWRWAKIRDRALRGQTLVFTLDYDAEPPTQDGHVLVSKRRHAK